MIQWSLRQGAQQEQQKQSPLISHRMLASVLATGAAAIALLPQAAIAQTFQTLGAEAGLSSPARVTLPLNRTLSSSGPALPPLPAPETFLPAPNARADVRLVLDLSDRRVYVYSLEQLQTSFPVAIGRAGWETPTGSFTVNRMVENPTWQHPFSGAIVPPGANNPLGSRWIGFWTDGDNAIGFHGTPNEETVGRAASHGCVRMFDRDVVSLFALVQVGTPVSVVP